jgi:phasin family protein
MAKTDAPKNPFPDVAKMIEQLKMPGLDVSGFIEAQRKNIEALTQANQAAFEGMQELAKRQMEILQETISEWQAAMSEAADREGANTARRADAAEKAFAKAFGNMRELAEMAAKAQTQAWEVIQKRFEENLADLRSLLQPPKSR